MAAHLLRRLALAVVLALFACTLIFVVVRLVDPHPSADLLGLGATPEQIAAKDAEIGVDQPLWRQYTTWLTGALGGDFGRSWQFGTAVSDLVVSRLPVTASIAVATTVVSGIVGAGVGLLAAQRGGGLDRVLQIALVAGFALPGFWVAIMLSSVFSVQLGWLPAVGYTPLAESPLGWLRSILLPVLALTLGSAAAIAQQMRNSAREVLAQGYVTTLRSRGVPARRILLRHVARNAAPTSLTTLSLQFTGLFGGAIVLEQVFALPGLGGVATPATAFGDVPVVMAVVLVSVLVTVVVNVVTEFLQTVLNPRARRPA
jgi:peptide/nickel transport system permease protein